MFKRLLFKFFLLYVIVFFLSIGISYWFYSREFALQMRQNMEEFGIDLVNGFAANLQRSLEEIVPAGEKAADAMNKREVREKIIDVAAGASVPSGVLFASIYNRNGDILVETGMLELNDTIPLKDITLLYRDRHILTSIRLWKNDLEFLDMVQPLKISSSSGFDRESFLFGEEYTDKQEEPIGFVRLGLDLTPMQSKIRDHNKKILTISSILSLVTALIIFLTVKRMIQPLQALRSATKIVASGALDYQVKVKTSDEIGDLAKSFGEMTEALKNSRKELLFQAKLLQNAADLAIGLDLEGNLIYMNDAAKKTFNYYGDIDLRYPFLHFLPEKEHDGFKRIIQIIIKSGEWSGEVVALRNKTIEFPFELAGVLLNEERGIPFAVIMVGRDITEQRRLQKELKTHMEDLEKIVSERTREIRETYEKLKQTQAQLLQSEKMAGIGQLAAGMAHEINNPLGFIMSNLSTLMEYIRDISAILNKYEVLKNALQNGAGISGGEIYELKNQIDMMYQELDINSILQDIKPLIAESIEGSERVKEIILNLKNFARLDGSDKKTANINDCIESTLKIVWNELKYKAEIKKKYGEIPQIHCYPGQLNQVFMNLFVNAVQAIPDKGTISIETRATATEVIAQISDTGHGIPKINLTKIFDPFFTTKQVGKGTGLGLSISYGIIQNHGGSIDVESEVGKGTIFTVRLPITEAENEQRTHSPLR